MYGGFANGYYAANNNATAGSWVSLEIPEPIWPYKMEIYANGDYTTSHLLGNAIFSWQCSNDNQNWITLHTISSLSNTSKMLYTFYNVSGVSEKYKYFRLYVNQASNTTYWNVGHGQVSGVL